MRTFWRSFWRAFAWGVGAAVVQRRYRSQQNRANDWARYQRNKYGPWGGTR